MVVLFFWTDRLRDCLIVGKYMVDGSIENMVARVVENYLVGNDKSFLWV